VTDSSDVKRLALLQLLAARLERLSADSLWARRASGARGSVLKALEVAEQGEPPRPEQLDNLIEQAFVLLERAAREIPDLEEYKRR
jgi:hypothetical protein